VKLGREGFYSLPPPIRGKEESKRGGRLGGEFGRVEYKTMKQKKERQRRRKKPEEGNWKREGGVDGNGKGGVGVMGLGVTMEGGPGILNKVLS
jgi:hypothetical protein